MLVTLSCIWKGNSHFFQWFPTAYQDTVSFILSCSIEMLLRNRGKTDPVGWFYQPFLPIRINNRIVAFPFILIPFLSGYGRGVGVYFPFHVSYSQYLSPLSSSSECPREPKARSFMLIIYCDSFRQSVRITVLRPVALFFRYPAGQIIRGLSNTQNKHWITKWMGWGLYCFPRFSHRARSNVIKLATGQFPFRLLAGRVFAIFG